MIIQITQEVFNKLVHPKDEPFCRGNNELIESTFYYVLGMKVERRVNYVLNGIVTHYIYDINH